MHLKKIWAIVREAGQEWMDDNAMRLSAALAFYTILSLAPLFVVAVAIVGSIFGQDAATGALTAQLRSQFGDAGAEVATTALVKSNRPDAGLAATLLSSLFLIFGASSVFSELQDALNAAWNVKVKPGRGFWNTIRIRLLSFGTVLLIGVLLFASVIATVLLAAFGSTLEGRVPGLPAILNLANVFVGFAFVAILFALLFKILPDVRMSWRDVWLGAAVSAFLFTAGKYGIGFYLGRTGIASPFGAAGSLVVFVVWLYYSYLILFFGAEVAQVTARHNGRPAVPTERALAIATS